MVPNDHNSWGNDHYSTCISRRKIAMNNQDYYNKEYVPQVNKIGKITGYLGVLLSFTPALVLAIVYGILPKPAALLTAFIS